MVVAAAARAPQGKQLRAIIEHYLGVEHLKIQGWMCPSTLARRNSPATACGPGDD